ncbi:MAG TPA: PP2C family serine/threonine-protein phosphatase [Methylomirabilota bacterium]|jgi:protein phosphatase
MVMFFGQTDIGRRRSLNEDTIYAQDGLFLVCDGMGGHKAGEVASKLAVEAIAGFVRRSEEDPEMTWPYGYDTKLSYDANRLGTAVKLANRIVFRKGASADEYTGMGTTVAAVLVAARRSQMTFAHVGDSRVYVVRADTMRQLTRDDSWANLGWSEEDPADSPVKNILTKALGAREDVEFDVVDEPLTAGDVVLLCSDGLTNMLSDTRILEILTAHAPDLEAATGELIARANEEGGRDNISVVLFRYPA